MTEKESLLEFCGSEYLKGQLTYYEYLKCQIAIEYLFEQTTYDGLVKQFFVSISTVKRAINETAPKVFGANIASRLKQIGKNNRDNSDKRRKYLKIKREKIRIPYLDMIVKPNIEELDTREIKVINCIYMFLYQENSYQEISDALDISKGMISIYLNGERIKGLLNDNVYEALRLKLDMASVSPSNSSNKCYRKI